MDRSKQRIPSLDGLRAVAILMVILRHALRRRQLPHALFPLARYGGFGVSVFFVISGFLITALLLKEHEKTGTISLRKFYARRAYRILPASSVVILLIAVFWHDTVGPRNLLCSLFYVQDFNPQASWPLAHMWSLAVEEQFYFLWPFLLLTFFRHRGKVAMAAVVIAPLFRATSGFMGFHHAEARWFPSAMDGLAMGCLLAIYKDRIASWSVTTDRLFLPVLAGTLLLANFSYPPGVQPLLVLSLENFGIAFCVDNCIRHRYRVLNCTPLVWVSTLSYSIYLIQMLFFRSPPTHVVEKLPINLFCIVAAAVACHYLVERPFLMLRDSRRRKLHRAQLVAQAEA
jgi:peptidoglycan/LPS O-acetylase OafA/YrhL